MPRVGLHGNNVAFLQVEIVYVVIISLACVLELHLNKVGRFHVAWNVGEIVVRVELLVLSAASFATQAAVGASGYFVIQVFKVHSLLSIF